MTIHTSLLTPTHIFQKEQQLLVPLFQRPYTWNRKEQWEPLWADVIRVATRLLEGKDNCRFSCRVCSTRGGSSVG